MRNFIKTDKIEEILTNFSKIKSDAYYVKMALAWFYAELATVNFDLAKKQISATKDAFIRNKSISKSCESYRLNIEQKTQLKQLKV